MAFLDPSTRALLESLLAMDAAAASDPLRQQALQQISDIRSLTAALEAEPALLAAVRAAGDDWEAIGQAAGLKPAAAKWRWQGTDDEIALRHDQGRSRARTSSKPSDLPGLSVAEAAEKLGVSVQAIYLQVTRGNLRAETVTLDDGRSYKRVFPVEREVVPKLTKADLPGVSVSEAAAARGVSSQAIYQLIARGVLTAETVVQNGRSYKRVLDEVHAKE